MNRAETDSGIFAVLVGLTVVVLIIIVGFFVFIKSTKDREVSNYVRELYQRKSLPSENTAVPTISESDTTETIEKELNDTDLGVDDLEKELNDLDSDATSL